MWFIDNLIVHPLNKVSKTSNVGAKKIERELANKSHFDSHCWQVRSFWPNE